MVHSWRCNFCQFTAWSDDRSSLDARIESHLFEHYAGNVAKTDYRYVWSCPYCSKTETGHEKERVVDGFKTHLREHVTDEITPNSHVGEAISWSGHVLVKAPIESSGADNARAHFLAPADLAIIVTSNPRERIKLLNENRSAGPAKTVIITSKRNPLSKPFDTDLHEGSVEVVELDQRLGPDGLGETISRVIGVHNEPDTKLSFAFENIYEIIQSFDLQTSYNFVSQISSRLRDADALSHFYISPHPQLQSILNVFEDQFDLQITAEDRVFISE